MRVAICDDEPVCLDDEESIIRKAFNEKGIECEIDSFNSPKDLLESEKRYDIIFLDVEMDGMNGIETADKIHEENKNALIFFVTNHEGYMDEALNKHAFRFWVKPINHKRLLYGIESAFREINNNNIYLNVTVGKRMTRILMKDIIFIFAKSKATSIVTRNGILNVKEPFKYVNERLNPEYFCRSHASYCINLNYVIKYNNTEVICRCGNEEYTAYMSKRMYPCFSKRFMEWTGDNL